MRTVSILLIYLLSVAMSLYVGMIVKHGITYWVMVANCEWCLVAIADKLSREFKAKA